jgi:hypothetical protein
MAVAEIRPVHVINGGAHRGAALNLPYFEEFNRNSQVHKLEVTYVDPVPGRAVALADRASSMGVPAWGMEGRIEACLPALRREVATPLLLNIDRPRELASVLRASSGVPVLGYIVVRSPNAELLGIRIVAEAHDDNVKEMIAQFFDCLGDVTARRGHNVIFGENGEASHLAIEPLYRSWFARHAAENLPKLVAGLEPDSAPIEITRDGVTPLPLLVRDNRAAWGDPVELARQVANFGAPLVRGENFVVGELGPDGVRFHLARVRKLDGELSVKRMGVAAPRADNDNGAFSSFQPVFTTD